MGTNEFTDAETFKGNDIDTDGDGTVNDAELLQGNQPSELKTDVSPIYEFMNDAAATQERHDLELSINSWNYDDGFIDIFWDQSKVSSSTGVDIVSGAESIVRLETSVTGSRTVSGQSNADNEWLDVYSKTNALEEMVEITITSNGTNTTYSDVRVLVNGEVVLTKDEVEIAYNGSHTFNLGIKATGQNVTVQERHHQGQYVDFDLDINSLSLPVSGSITHIRKDLDFTPSKFVANPDYDSSGTGESVELEISDNSGNSVVLSESDFGSEFSVNFDDGNIQVSAQLTGDGSSSPEYYKTKVLGVQ